MYMIYQMYIIIVPYFKTQIIETIHFNLFLKVK